MRTSHTIRVAKGRIAKIELTLESESVAHIDWLSVPPQDRGKGLARKLMDAVVTEADAERVVLTLVSKACGKTANSPADERLEAFYASYGFVRTGEFDQAHKGPVMFRTPA